MAPRLFPLLASALAASLLAVSCASREPPATAESRRSCPGEPAASAPSPVPGPAPRPPLETPPAPEPSAAPPAPPALPGAESPGAAFPGPEEPRDALKPPPWYVEMEGHYEQAMIALRRGEKEEAIALFDRVLAHQSTHKAAAIMKSRTLRELGRAGEGLHDVETALDRRPEDLSLLEELAAVHLAVGEPEKALDAVARALAIGGAVPGVRYVRAAALAELGDRDGALAALEDALLNGFVNLAVLEREKRFEPLANEPRFRDVVAAMEEFRRAVEASKR